MSERSSGIDRTSPFGSPIRVIGSIGGVIGGALGSVGRAVSALNLSKSKGGR